MVELGGFGVLTYRNRVVIFLGHPLLLPWPPINKNILIRGRQDIICKVHALLSLLPLGVPYHLINEA